MARFTLLSLVMALSLCAALSLGHSTLSSQEASHPFPQDTLSRDQTVRRRLYRFAGERRGLEDDLAVGVASPAAVTDQPAPTPAPEIPTPSADPPATSIPDLPSTAPVETTTTTTTQVTTTTTTVTTSDIPSPSPSTSTSSSTSSSSSSSTISSTSSKEKPTHGGGGDHTSYSAKPSGSDPDGVVRPSDTPASSDNGSNRTGITIGVVVGAIVIAGGIGVWVFRKWKLSPSRNFKSKIRNSSSLNGSGPLGSGDDGADHDYDTYNDIFRPTAHESALPPLPPAMALAMPMTNTSNSVSGTSPQQQHAHLSMASSNTGTVPDYNQYRYASGISQQQQQAQQQGYDSGLLYSESSAGMSHHPSWGSSSHPEYADYDPHYQQHQHNDHFLRELRE